jgi:GTP-binding protein EngB required for normal cell division
MPSEFLVASSTHDIGGDLSDALRVATELAAAYHLDAVKNELDSLLSERGRPSYRVVVVGESNRGKSTLINHLVGRKALQTGPLSVSRNFVLVAPGDDESVHVEWRERLSHRSRGPEMSDAVPDTDGDAVVGQVLQPPHLPVRAVVSDPWLMSIATELVDTPGTDVGDDDQLAVVRRALTMSDAVVMVVSALAPFSVTERRLLEAEILNRHLTVLAVVLTMVDLVDRADQAEVVAALRVRLRPLLPDVPVLVAPSPDGSDRDLDEIRELIGRCASDGRRGQRRTERVAALLVDHCDAMAALAADADALAGVAAEKRQEKIDKATAALDLEALEWDRLRVELDERRQSLTRTMKARVEQARESVLDTVRVEVRRAPDPQQWWQTERAPRLREQLAKLHAEIEQLIVSRIGSDIDWLESEVVQRFPEATPHARPQSLTTTIAPSLTVDVADLTRQKQVIRIGAKSVGLFAQLLAMLSGAPQPGLWGGGVGLAGGVVADDLVDSMTRRQRLDADALVVRSIDDSTRAFADEAADELRHLYGGAFAELHRQRDSWREARIMAMGRSAPGATPDWAVLATKARALSARVRATQTLEERS